MSYRDLSHAMRAAALLLVLTACEDITAPKAAMIVTEMERRVTRLIADPKVFSDVDALFTVAHVEEAGVTPALISVVQDSSVIAYKAIGYEVVLENHEGRIDVWRRGMVAWRGDPVEELFVIWAPSPGDLARPHIQAAPQLEPPPFAHRRAYRLERNATAWQGTGGRVSVRPTADETQCTFRSAANTDAVRCVNVTFEVSFEIAFERRTAEIDSALFHSMMESGAASVPFVGADTVLTRQQPTLIPGVRFTWRCTGARDGAEEAACVSRDAPPSP